jgi:hypothetical protein
VGTQSVSGISDTEIRDAVWEFYFDVQEAVSYLLGGIFRRVNKRFLYLSLSFQDEQTKKRAANAKKGKHLILFSCHPFPFHALHVIHFLHMEPKKSKLALLSSKFKSSKSDVQESSRECKTHFQMLTDLIGI